MTTVTVTSKFQVVIPRAVRDRLNIQPGQKMQDISHKNRLELIPLRPIRELRRMLQAIETGLEREPDGA
jgi:AbrB family looped-hinge helix DNA binding protein